MTYSIASYSLLVSAALALVATTPIHPRAAASWPDPEPYTWYRFSTNDNILIANAPSLNGPWTYQQQMLPQGSIIKVAADQELWAPDVHLIDNTYHVYYAVSTLGSQASDIGVATAPSLEVGSTWTDHGSLGIPKSSNYNLIDPNLFRDGGDTHHFVFGSFWRDIFHTTLSAADPTTWSGVTPANVVYNSTIRLGTTTTTVEEGAFQFSTTVRGTPWHYLFFSSGLCCQAPDALAPAGEEYKVMVCRAAAPTGPFVDQAGNSCLAGNGGTLVLGSHGFVYAPGGQGVLVDDGGGRDVLYYHYVDTRIGYAYADFQFGFNYLDFESGWPVVTT
ncbi:endo-1,5-alpha-L-arabinosidase [Mytilinidion resinicola]|uniref:Arabinan endo-1,5-alpha-L-arabinosidase n=1 Tax=Mytilinidion resinicola TaxID=574789 RepID=A0A6A6Z8P1_9PEZI|nr:endo-1,5-alpha-L-arabinosidase [Mytilinidion resinicola]KAF2816664.1 endo-1,5-alpha-L-arabinosidase [Mytilinidion resinicola]